MDLDWLNVEYSSNEEDAFMEQLSNEQQAASTKMSAYMIAASFFADYIHDHRQMARNWSWLRTLDLCILAFENTTLNDLSTYAARKHRTRVSYRKSYAIPFLWAVHLNAVRF